MPKGFFAMKVSSLFISTLLVSSLAFAQGGLEEKQPESDESARLSLNQDEIKRAHARLLAAEEKLKLEIDQTESSTTATKVVTTSTTTASKSPTTEKASKVVKNSQSSPELAKLRQRISTLEAENIALSREASVSRDRLVVAEIEVERLQGILDNKTRRIMSPISLNAPAAVEPQSVSTKQVEKTNPLTTVEQEEKASADMPIATITARKANLRVGPSETDSPLMEVAYGTRLVVETRTGDWYRVIAPTGVRAWISAKVVAFGDTASTSPTRVTRIAGFNQGVEDEAFGLISSLSN
jgi:hypothetical protein